MEPSHPVAPLPFGLQVHDQELIAEVATRIWALRPGQEVVDFSGTYAEFMEKHADLASQRR